MKNRGKLREVSNECVNLILPQLQAIKEVSVDL